MNQHDPRSSPFAPIPTTSASFTGLLHLRCFPGSPALVTRHVGVGLIPFPASVASSLSDCWDWLGRCCRCMSSAAVPVLHVFLRSSFVNILPVYSWSYKHKMEGTGTLWDWQSSFIASFLIWPQSPAKWHGDGHFCFCITASCISSTSLSHGSRAVATLTWTVPGQPPPPGKGVSSMLSNYVPFVVLQPHPTPGPTWTNNCLAALLLTSSPNALWGL